MFQQSYDVADCQPVCIELNEKHFFVFVLIGSVVVLIVFLLFRLGNGSDQLVELLFWLYFDEFVLGSALGVGDENPTQTADAHIDGAIVKFSEEEEGGNYYFPDGKAVQEELSEGGGA